MSRFQHYLSYGSTDQETARALTRHFDGLIVPGTVAAFQAEGTKGFVLSLSARSNEPYAIDPRFPLFQNEPVSWKKSHLLLANIFGFEEQLIAKGHLEPSDFDDTVISLAAEGWLKFNIDFENVRSKTFDKYAARLPEDDIAIADRRSPDWILPPYFMASGLDSPWLAVSEQLWKRSVELLEGRAEQAKLRKVIAADSAALWSQLVASSDLTEVIGWVSHLDELDTSEKSVGELAAYGRAIRDADSRGQSVFALYGGFFSVLLNRYGLQGASRGVGYGEYRDYIELPSSGAPAARYYIPRLHRYVSVDIATAIWDEAPDLVECGCVECGGRSPEDLEYHELMRHSVRMRKLEIDVWPSLSTAEVRDRLLSDFREFADAVEELSVPRSVRRRAEGVYPHLASWARALESIEDDR